MGLAARREPRGEDLDDYRLRDGAGRCVLEAAAGLRVEAHQLDPALGLPDALALETLNKPKSLPTMRTSVLHYTAEVTLPL